MHVFNEVAKLYGYTVHSRFFGMFGTVEVHSYTYTLNDGPHLRRSDLPQWTDNLEDAVQLFSFLDNKYNLHIKQTVIENKRMWLVYVDTGKREPSYQFTDTEPAFAVCMVYLDFMKQLGKWIPPEDYIE